MNCVVCRAELGSGARFCPVCGASADAEGRAQTSGRRCPKCLAPVAVDASSCSSCGYPLAAERPLGSGVSDLEAGKARVIETPYAWMECHGEEAEMLQARAQDHEVLPLQRKAEERVDSPAAQKNEVETSAERKFPGTELSVPIFAIVGGIFIAMMGIGAGAWLMLASGSSSQRTAPKADASLAILTSPKAQIDSAIPAPKDVENQSQRISDRREPISTVGTVQSSASFEQDRPKSTSDGERSSGRRWRKNSDDEYVKKMKRQLDEQLKEMRGQ